MLGICSKYLNANPEVTRFPVIYPIILSNSPTAYNVPRNIWDLFVNPGLAKQFWTNDCNVIDLAQTPDEKLEAQVWAGSMQLFLKHVNEGRRLKEIIKNRILLLHKYDNNDELIETLLVYGLTTMEENDKMDITKFLNEKFGKKEGERIMASVAQKWYDEGIDKGIEKGIEKGVVNTAINMLKQNTDLKFISSVTGLSIDTLQKLKASL